MPAADFLALHHPSRLLTQNIAMEAYEKQLLKAGQILEIPDEVDHMSPSQ